MTEATWHSTLPAGKRNWNNSGFLSGTLRTRRKQHKILQVVQFLSHVWLFVAPWTAARQASLSFTMSRSLLKLMSIEWMMPSNHLTLCRPLLLLPSILPNIRVFSNESVLCIRWPKYWSLYQYWISIQDWLPLGLTSWISLLFKGLKSLLQHHSSKESILWCSAFFMVQVSHPYTTSGKTIALTVRTFVSKEPIHQEDITILVVCAPNYRVSKYMK